MSATSPSNLDAPVPPLSLLHPIQPNNMLFIHRNQTRLELANALSLIVNTSIPSTSRVWLVASELEVIITFLVCSIMLYKKQALGKLWIITRRSSPGGTFWVANAVFVLTLGVSAYLMAWGTSAVAIVAFSYVHAAVLEWWWVIPLPWLPLVLGAYVSIHGFTVGCSPRSPLSRVHAANAAARSKWYYVGIPNSAAVVNAVLVLPSLLFTISTIALVGMSGHNYYHAKASARHLLPPDVQVYIADRSSGRSSSLADGDTLASDELVWMARIVAASYMQVHRYVCINLAVFAGAATALNVPCLMYGVPNIISLVDHAYSRYTEPLPANCTSFTRKLWFLLTQGRPRSDQTSASINLETWKMTILAIGYISILIVCIPAYGWLPIYIICDIFPHRMLSGDVSPVIHRAALAVSIISIISCTFVAIFCTVATLDPLFRAAIGLNVIRTQIPIDIQVEFHRSQFEEHVSNGLYDGSAKTPTIRFKPSTSSMGSAPGKSPADSKFPDYPGDSDRFSATLDVEAATPPRS
ncbi:probable Dik6, novel virulence factor [Sporisorium reilianum SRZ2]|uniref:Probable Dik6, novel virulence factor n=1 Tax=Sporisorium reilianum (strain SRZ2) TaxID=999809 RepID=E6ZNS2_SPORE|nr:probable Dik6, novel virulence factor [Sporisorium reilianum SRZ2]